MLKSKINPVCFFTTSIGLIYLVIGLGYIQAIEFNAKRVTGCELFTNHTLAYIKLCNEIKSKKYESNKKNSSRL